MLSSLLVKPVRPTTADARRAIWQADSPVFLISLTLFTHLSHMTRPFCMCQWPLLAFSLNREALVPPITLLIEIDPRPDCEIFRATLAIVRRERIRSMLWFCILYLILFLSDVSRSQQGHETVSLRSILQSTTERPSIYPFSCSHCRV